VIITVPIRLRLHLLRPRQIASSLLEALLLKIDYQKDTWKKLCRDLSLAENYETLGIYPDEVLYKLIGAIGTLAKLSQQEVIEAVSTECPSFNLALLVLTLPLSSNEDWLLVRGLRQRHGVRQALLDGRRLLR